MIEHQHKKVNEPHYLPSLLLSAGTSLIIGVAIGLFLYPTVFVGTPQTTVVATPVAVVGEKDLQETVPHGVFPKDIDHDVVIIGTTTSQNVTEPKTTTKPSTPIVQTPTKQPLAERSVTQSNTTPRTTIVPVNTPMPTKNGVHASRIADIEIFEKRTGDTIDILASAIHWGNENAFPTELANAMKEREGTLFIFWYAMDYRGGAYDQSKFHYSKILDGSWDAYIESFVASARAHKGNVIIAPFEEANGYWTYWNGDNGQYGTKEEYKAAFRYLHDKFSSAPNVSFAWVMNQVSVPNTAENSISTYYPGDAYVDIIGINAFNFGTPWISFNELVEKAVAEVKKYNKPIYITSTASADGSKKAEWIRDFFNSKYFSEGTLAGWIWFNLNKERNWLVWSDPNSEKVFKELLSKYSY